MSWMKLCTTAPPLKNWDMVDGRELQKEDVSLVIHSDKKPGKKSRTPPSAGAFLHQVKFDAEMVECGVLKRDEVKSRTGTRPFAVPMGATIFFVRPCEETSILVGKLLSFRPEQVRQVDFHAGPRRRGTCGALAL